MDFRYATLPHQVSYGASLLLVLLQLFPEVGLATYDPANKGILRLIFFVVDPLTPEEQQQLDKLIGDNVRAFHHLIGNSGPEDYFLQVGFGSEECLQRITIDRDVKTLSRDELQLVVAVANDRLGDNIVREQIRLPEQFDEVTNDEELIDQLMDQLRLQPVEMRLWGIKDEGRAAVFHK